MISGNSFELIQKVLSGVEVGALCRPLELFLGCEQEHCLAGTILGILVPLKASCSAKAYKVGLGDMS